MEDEIWKDISGLPGYQISNMGNLRSFRGKGPGHVFKLEPHPILSTLRSNGYKAISIRKDMKLCNLPIHVLVLEAFIGPRPENMDACHNNGIRTDNRVDNLRWDTRTANFLDRRWHGTAPWGENNNRAKLTEAQVKEIRQLSEGGENFNSIGRKFGISGTHVGRIVHRKCWFHI